MITESDGDLNCLLILIGFNFTYHRYEFVPLVLRKRTKIKKPEHFCSGFPFYSLTSFPNYFCSAMAACAAASLAIGTRNGEQDT